MTGPLWHSPRFSPFARAVVVAVLCLAPGLRAVPAESEKFRIGFSYSMFSGVNENDAKASIRGMAADFSVQRHLPAEPEPHLYDGVAAIIAGVRSREVNYVGITTEEFAALRGEVTFDRLSCGAIRGEQSVTYVLLVHRGANETSLADLQGRSLSLMSGPRMSLATLWLDVELAKQGQPTTGEYFRQSTGVTKPAKAVLAVFFRQVDACLVSREMFNTMAELNPQVARDLQVVATSPPFIPAFFGFVAGFAPALRDRSIREFAVMHESASGRQLLALFQTEQIRELNMVDLDSSIALVDEHARRCPAASASRRDVLHVPGKPAGGTR